MPITVAQLVTNAVSELGGDLTATAEYYDYAIPSVNKMLADLFEINNARLANAEETELTEIPEVDASSDTIPYQAEIVRNVMVHGLARDLGRMESHPAVGAFTRQYDENKARYDVASSTSITDYYTETE